jgi:hypothetical protein
MNMKKLLALVAVFALVAFAAPAFAANPFVDVPMNHWAYDAVSHLAAKGIIQGYPDGTYRGNQPMTRYEMSMLVARALATVDMEKASKEDVEMLKKLVVEFKDELDALGVRVDALDERVAVLEEGIGGWKFWGELRFDARWADEGDGAYANSDSQSGYAHNGETEFDLNRYRLWISKQIDDKTTVTMRLGGSSISWQRYFATIQLPWDSYLMVGQWNYDWEGEAGLYIDEDAWFTDQTLKGFYWRKNLAKGDITLFATHDEKDGKDKDGNDVGGIGDRYNYGARFNFNMNDKFRIAISGLYFDYDNDGNAKLTYSSSGAERRLWNGNGIAPSKAVPPAPAFESEYYDYGTYWADFGITFSPGFEFKGAYYIQDHDGPNGVSHFDDSPNAYKAIIDVSQDVMKFTSLWIEYAKFDPNFHTALDPWDAFGAELTPNLTMPAVSNVWETEAIFVRLEQKWDDKWVTYQRYGQFDHSMEGYAISPNYYGSGSYDITNWTFGVQYWYTPTVMFELAYDDVDYDDGWYNNIDKDLKDDNLIRFRTHIFF